MNASNIPQETNPCPVFLVADDMETLEMRVQLITLVPREQMVKESGPTKLLADLKSLLNRANEYKSDFSIICSGQNFPCHEAILRARSPVFDRLFQQEMEESTTRKITIQDVNKDTIDAALEFIYTGEITKNVKNVSELIYFADKYDIADLLELSFHKVPGFEDHMVVDILIQADRHGLEYIKNEAIQRILMDKSKFVKDEDFVEKMKQVPHLLLELIQL